MKTSIKIILLSLLTPLFAGAMHQNQMAAESSQAKSLISIHQAPILGYLWLDCYKEIIINAGSLEEIGKCARTFTMLCKALNRHLNDVDNDWIPTNNYIIPRIACKTHCYEWRVALALRTAGAQKWLISHPEYLKIKNWYFSHLDFPLARNAEYYPDAHSEEQEVLDKVRFLIRTIPSLASIGTYPGLTGTRSLVKMQNLIASGVDVNLQDQSRKTTALMNACQEKNLEKVKLLLKAGAHTLLKNYDGKDALMHVHMPRPITFGSGSAKDIPVAIIQEIESLLKETQEIQKNRQSS